MTVTSEVARPVRRDVGLALFLAARRGVTEEVLLWWAARTAFVGDCLEWQRGRSGDGYGSAHREGRTVGAHRLAWSDLVGPIPDGLHVLHRCDNPPCVLPGHLFLGTQAANVHDALAKRRHRNFRRRERCPEGHLVAGENAYWYRGYAQCKLCRRAAFQRFKEGASRDDDR